MKKSMLALMLLVFCAVLFTGYTESPAKVTVKVENNRSHNIFLSFWYAGFDVPDDQSRGWWKVKAGEKKNIVLADANYAFCAGALYYYATGGGYVWKAKDGENLSYIHPKKKFCYKGGKQPGQGSIRVPMRRVELKEVEGSYREDGVVKLIFN